MLHVGVFRSKKMPRYVGSTEGGASPSADELKVSRNQQTSDLSHREKRCGRRTFRTCNEVGMPSPSRSAAKGKEGRASLGGTAY